MRKQLGIMVVGVSLWLVGPVWADWDPGDPYKMHFPQLPDPTGWDICLVDQWVADDFACTESGPINDIHFWTSWYQDQEGIVPDPAWDISIWSDAGGIPGVRLWQLMGATFTTRWYGTGDQGWACPSTGFIVRPDHQLYYQVNVTNILEPFYQWVDTRYWLVIRANIMQPQVVGWKTSVNDPPGPLYGAPALWSIDQMGWQLVNTGTMFSELHDMAFVITGGHEEEWDFGDANDPPYPTLLMNNGARHLIVPGIYMGGGVDGEPDGQPDPNALGDDNDGNDDEDGVTNMTPLTPGGTATVDVTVSVGGFIYAWMDFDGDGTWGGPSEQIFAAQAVAAGVNTLGFTVPTWAPAGLVTYARFRFETTGAAALSYTGPAYDGEVEDYEVYIVGEIEEYRFEFSLDIGSDIELSDPNVNGNEAADPGDVYWWQSAPIVPPGRDGEKDDMFMFGMDPFPDPPDPFIPPATRVPVGMGSIFDYPYYFDLDGHDQLDYQLADYMYPLPMFPSNCIWWPQHLYISYDDDMAPGWPVADVPVVVPSPMGLVYGTTMAQDEVVGVNLMIGGPPPYPTLQIYPLADEVTVHPSMVPNPDWTEQYDDDVDSLDIVPNVPHEEGCPFWYFTADHEANWGLDPGSIYMAAPGLPILVADDVMHLGLTEDTDVDAFEFTWMEDFAGGGGVFLAIVFSVDDDDPLTPGDESGGLPSDVLFGSFMTGYFFPVTNPLGDDVDALTIWREPLGGDCVCQDARSLLFHGATELALTVGCQNGIEPRFGGVQKLEIDLDDATVFGGTVTVGCSPWPWVGVWGASTVGNTVTVTFNPGLPDQSKCTLTLDCGAQVCVRNLEGDSNRSGVTNATDNSQRKLLFGQAANAGNAQWDVNLSALINATDNAQTKLRFGNSAPSCP